MPQNYGATPEDWAHFELILGVGEDLLPVVSDPSATISPNSKMKSLGKTPSLFNRSRGVVGVPDWTAVRAGPDDLSKWAQVPEYGICVQTRSVRALDVDVTNPEEADRIRAALAHLGLPCRSRSNSSKFLLAFTLPGDYFKSVIKTQHGIIEFLATGQQFVAVGAHFNSDGKPSGARYEWANGLPDAIPALSAAQFEKVWTELQLQFGVEPATASKATVAKSVKLQEANENDETARHLLASGYVLSTERDGKLHITCPFEHEHTGVSADSATTYFPANTGGFVLGHFKCLHAHCANRTDADFRQELGIVNDDFEDLTEVKSIETPEKVDTSPALFAPQSVAQFLTSGQETEWLIKNVLPKAELAFVYGEPASGKTFLALDMAMHIARGCAWNAHKTKQSQVLYIAAEDANGVRKRVQAYQQYHGAEVDYSGLRFIADAPQLLQEKDRKELWAQIKSCGALDVIILDTLAASTPGIDENSSKEFGPLLHYCKQISKRTGALILFVHHTGKDPLKGMRGSSVLLGASDCLILVERFGDDRVATIAKLKNGVDKAEYGFKLNVVELGVDSDGDTISSCVVNYLPPGSAKKVPVTKDSVPRLLLNLTETLTVAGAVSVNDLVEGAVAQMPYTDTGKRDTRRNRVQEAYETLLADGYLICTDGFVTVA